jgi:uncharacterized protein
MHRLKDLLKKLLCIEDTPERTALAFSVGVLLGFSPFIGFHTLTGLAIAFLFRLNRLAILIGVWSNMPWWVLPYYSVATWLGTKLVGFQFDEGTITAIFRPDPNQGLTLSGFWSRLAPQWGLLLSFLVGSMLLACLLALVVYPLSLRWIRFYRSKRCS